MLHQQAARRPNMSKRRSSARVAAHAAMVAARRPLPEPFGTVLAGARRQRISPQFRRALLEWIKTDGAAQMRDLNASCDGLIAHSLRFAALSPATALAIATALIDAGADPDLESYQVNQQQLKAAIQLPPPPPPAPPPFSLVPVGMASTAAGAGIK